MLTVIHKSLSEPQDGSLGDQVELKWDSSRRQRADVVSPGQRRWNSWLCTQSFP